MEATQNQSTIKDILILGLQDLHNYRITVFLTLLVIYLASTAANLLIIVLVVKSHHLFHTPMYFFLTQLSITDIVISSTVCSTLLPAIWRDSTLVAFAGCLTQFFIFANASFVECFLLTVMSYDRYLAICKPLHYAAMMNLLFCMQLTICSWILGFMVALTLVIMINNLHFCGPLSIQHFFCDLEPLLELSCSDTTLLHRTVIILATPETAIESTFIITTYIYIFLTILRIPSSSGRQKAFSTCSSHLAVVCTYYGSLIAIYVVPSRGHLVNLNKSLSLLYTVITPLLNPLIYSLKNVEIRMVLQKYLQKPIIKNGQM